MGFRVVDVVVLMLTYNHHKWLGKALDSILSQKTHYSYVTVVHDDASTDGTDNILREYEKKYPEKIIAIYEKINQYQTGNLRIERMIENIQCKYVAFCEGDDFWIDENKLEKQINYMERHSGCSFSCSNAWVVDVDNKVLRPFFSNYLWKDEHILQKLKEKETNFSAEENIILDFLPTASCVFTSNAFSEYLKFPIKLDLSMRLICAEKGYVHYFAEPMTAYRKGNSNSASGMAGKSFESMMKDFYKVHSDIYKEFNAYTNFKYNALVNKMLQRKYLQVLLKYEKFEEAVKSPVYSELKNVEIIKILIKRSPAVILIRPAYHYLIRLYSKAIILFR